MQKLCPLSSLTILKELHNSTVPAVEQIRTVTAIQHIRKMRGGSQAHLMRCSDGSLQVVKFRNNPQHTRILANEMLVGRLAAYVGLTVPKVVIVEVSEFLVRHTAALNVQLGGKTISCESGLQFGSQLVVSPLNGQVFDYLPRELLDRVRNLEEFAGMLVIDKWTSNADRRQATFHRKMTERKYTASFIDQGYCFNAGDWTFNDSALRGVYAEIEVYAGVNGWASFEPWLSRIEQIDEHVIYTIAGEIPPEWYDSNWTALEELVEQLLLRRGPGLIRGLIYAFRLSSQKPFPNWRDNDQEDCWV